MKKILFLVVINIITICAQSPSVETIINLVNKDSLLHYVKELSGVESPIVNGQKINIASRHSSFADNDTAALYIYEKLKSFGYDAKYHAFNTKGKNVIAEKIGNKYPNQYYIICGHYDSQPNDYISPGADDNASGTAAVMEAARILFSYNLPYTVKFILWDEEEQGLIGSGVYASMASQQKDSILGVINLDMISYDGNNDSKCQIHKKNIGSSNLLTNKMIEINNIFNIGLSVETKDPGTSASDHSRFWQYGYGAILLIEAMTDFHPYYHTVMDNYSNIKEEYFFKMSKMSIGTLYSFASEGSILSNNDFENGNNVSGFILAQNYPNPFNPVTSINVVLPYNEHITLKVHDIMGKEVAVLFEGYKEAGSYTFNFNAGNLSSGVYFYKLITDNFVSVKKMNLIK